MQYIEQDGTEHFHSLYVFPDRLTKKVTLLKYFRNYMNQHLMKVLRWVCVPYELRRRSLYITYSVDNMGLAPKNMIFCLQT